MIIVIIIILILTGITISVVIDTNIIETSYEAVFKQDVVSYKEYLSQYIMDKYIDSLGGLNIEDEDYPNYTGEDITGTIKEVIPSIKDEHSEIFEIVDGELVYVGGNDTEKEWAKDVGVDSPLNGFNITITPNGGATTEDEYVEISVDISSTGTITLDDIKNIEYFFSEDGSLNQEDTGIWLSSSSLQLGENINYKIEVNQYLYIRIEDLDGNYYTKVSNEFSISSIDLELESIIITSNPSTGYTNQNVTVEISNVSSKIIKTEYSFDGISWLTYNDNIIVENNCDIYFRFYENDTVYQQLGYAYSVNNIDKLVPQVSFNPSETQTTEVSTEIQITYIDDYETNLFAKSDLKSVKYYITSSSGLVESEISEWVEVSDDNLNEGYMSLTISVSSTDTKKYIYCLVEDNAGNTTFLKHSGVEYIDKTAPTLIFETEPSSWTNEDVTISLKENLKSDVSSMKYRFSEDDEYTEYNLDTNSLKVESICNIYFEARDASNNITNYTLEVKNIDKISPTLSWEVVGQTAYSESKEEEYYIDLTIEDPVDANDIASGITLVKYIKIEKETEIENLPVEESSLWEYAINDEIDLKDDGKDYYIYCLVKDVAGNYIIENLGQFTTRDIEGPELSTASITSTPSGWTNQNVTVKFDSALVSDISGAYYKFNEEDDWSVYNLQQNKLEVESISSIYFKVTDANNNSSEIIYIVDNIDKINPVISFGTVGQYGDDEYYISLDITDEGDEDNGNSGIEYIKYAKTSSSELLNESSSSWTDISDDKINLNDDGNTYYIQCMVSDKAGNVVIMSLGEYRTKDVIAPDTSDVAVIYSPSGWTNQDVTVTLEEIPSDAVNVLYRFDYEVTWNTYAAGISVSSNSTILFKLIDQTGNESEVITAVVNKIDKIAPTIEIEATDYHDDEKSQPYKFNITATDELSKLSDFKIIVSTDNSITATSAAWDDVEDKIASGTISTYNLSQELQKEENGVYYIYCLAIDSAGNETFKKYQYQTWDKTSPVFTINKEPDDYTNSSVKVSLDFEEDDLIEAYYKINEDENWTIYDLTNNELIIYENCTIYFKGLDEYENSSQNDCNIAKIDKIAPEITIEVTKWHDEEKTEPYTFYIKATDELSKIASYKMIVTDDDSITSISQDWEEATDKVTGSALEIITTSVELQYETNDTYYIYCLAIDDAGNETFEKYERQTWDKTAPDMTILQDPTTYTNSNVKLSLDYTVDDLVEVSYSIDNSDNWISYDINNNELVISNNCYVEFKGLDESNNEIIKNCTINIIDRLNPEIEFKLVGDIEFEEDKDELYYLEVTAKDESDDENVASGVKTVKYLMTETNTLIESNDSKWDTASSLSSTGGTINLTGAGGEYYIQYYIEDKAGNIDVGVINKYGIRDVEPPDITNVEIVLTPSDWTNQNITVTLDGVPDDAIKIEYSLDENTWLTYNTSGVIIETNTQIYFRLYDEAENYDAKTQAIYKIDKLDPQSCTFTFEEPSDEINNATGVDIKVYDAESTDEYGQSGIKQFKYIYNTSPTISEDDVLWDTASTKTGNLVSIDFDDINGEEIFVHVLATDNAGNIKVFTSETSHFVDVVAPNINEVEFEVSPEDDTNENVELWLLSYSSDTDKITYTSNDNSTETIYNINQDLLDIEENNTYKFYFYDQYGNKSTYTQKISNIDKLNPNTVTFSPTDEIVGIDTEFKLTATDSSNSTNKSTGIDCIKYIIASTQEPIINTSNVWLTADYIDSGEEIIIDEWNEITYIQAIAIDNVGNISDTSVSVGYKYDDIPPDISGITISIDPEEPTNENVTLTMNGLTDDINKIKYTIDDSESLKTYSVSKNSLTIEENATYTFYFYDSFDNESIMSEYTIDNIDKIAPGITGDNVSSNGDNVTVSPPITDGSTVGSTGGSTGGSTEGSTGSTTDKFKYILDSSPEDIPASSSLWDSVEEKEGDYDISKASIDFSPAYLHWYGVDEAGNVEVGTYGPIDIDAVGPTINLSSVSPNGSENQNQTVVSVYVEDAARTDIYECFGMQCIKYLLLETSDEIAADDVIWEDAEIIDANTETKTIDTTIIVNTDETPLYLHILAEDKVGNATVFVSNAYGVDTIAPEITYISAAYSDTTWTSEDVVITLGNIPTDVEKVEINSNGYWEEIEYIPGSGDDIVITAEQNGEISIRLLDKSGNESEVLTEAITYIDKTIPDSEISNIELNAEYRDDGSNFIKFDVGVSDESSDSYLGSEINTITIEINGEVYKTYSNVNEDIANYTIEYDIPDDFLGEYDFEIKVTVVDNAGNSIEKIVSNNFYIYEQANVDNVTITKSTEEATNEDVELNISGFSGISAIKIKADGSTTLKNITIEEGNANYSISENGSYVISFINYYGHTVYEENIDINNIDKKSPAISIENCNLVVEPDSAYYEISFNYSDEETLIGIENELYIEVKINDYVYYSNNTSSNDGSFNVTYNIDSSSPEDVSLNIVANISDKAGNANEYNTNEIVEAKYFYKIINIESAYVYYNNELASIEINNFENVKYLYITTPMGEDIVYVEENTNYSYSVMDEGMYSITFVDYFDVQAGTNNIEVVFDNSPPTVECESDYIDEFMSTIYISFRYYDESPIEYIKVYNSDWGGTLYEEYYPESLDGSFTVEYNAGNYGYYYGDVWISFDIEICDVYGNITQTNYSNNVYITCQECGGMGIMCESCMGSGTYQCWECSGTGMMIYSDSMMMCEYCWGTGCDMCSWTGYMDGMMEEMCQSCQGMGQITCESCWGSGYMMCPTCGSYGGNMWW